MRRTLRSLAVLTVLAALAGAAPDAAANDSTSPQTRAIEKNAATAARAIGQAASRTIAGAANDASREILALDRAARTGKDVASLSGVPSTPGTKVSEDQLRGLNDALFESIAEFHEAAVGAVTDAYAAAASNSALIGLRNSDSLLREAGAGGPPDQVAATAAAAWAAGNAKVVKSAGRLRATFARGGFVVTYADAVPRFLPPATLGREEDRPFPVPTVLVTSADQDGSVRAIVANGATTPVAGFDPTRSRIAVIAPERSEPLPSGDVLGGVTFFRHVDASFTSGSRFVGALFDGTSDLAPVALTPVSIPVRCPTPTERALSVVFSGVAGSFTGGGSFVSVPSGGDGFHSSPGVPDRPILPFTDLRGVTVATNVDRVLSSSEFPVGQGPNGFTIWPQTTASPSGPFHFFGAAFGAPIPLADATNRFQFTCVFDQDAEGSNNYVPPSSFANDTWRGTDRHYNCEYAPATGWRLRVTDFRTGSFVQVASASRVVIDGRVIVFAVPASELSGPDPAFRITAFQHTGDFGFSPPYTYSSDLFPLPYPTLQALGN